MIQAWTNTQTLKHIISLLLLMSHILFEVQLLVGNTCKHSYKLDNNSLVDHLLRQIVKSKDFGVNSRDEDIFWVGTFVSGVKGPNLPGNQPLTAYNRQILLLEVKRPSMLFMCCWLVNVLSFLRPWVGMFASHTI